MLSINHASSSAANQEQWFLFPYTFKASHMMIKKGLEKETGTGKGGGGGEEKGEGRREKGSREEARERKEGGKDKKKKKKGRTSSRWKEGERTWKLTLNKINVLAWRVLAVTKCHGFGGLNNRMYFLSIREAPDPRWRCRQRQRWFLPRPPSSGYRRHPPPRHISPGLLAVCASLCVILS